MKVGIIGANSFLANALRATLKGKDKHELHLWSKSLDVTLAEQAASVYAYDYPAAAIKAQEVLPMDYVFICTAAGVQPKNVHSLAQVYEINAFEPIRLLNELNLLGYGGTVVTFGSYFEMGANHLEHKSNENEVVFSQLPPLNPYSTSKRILSRFVYDHLQRNKRYRLFHFFLSNIYGFGENSSRLIPYVVNAIYEKEAIMLGSGSQIRQYTHIKDVADFLVQLIEYPTASEGLYCLSVHQQHSVKEVVEQALTLAEKKGLLLPPIQFNLVQRTDQSAAYLGLDSGKATMQLNWLPSVSLAAGIDEYFIHMDRGLSKL